jgi:hypothetical protein
VKKVLIALSAAAAVMFATAATPTPARAAVWAAPIIIGAVIAATAVAVVATSRPAPAATGTITVPHAPATQSQPGGSRNGAPHGAPASHVPSCESRAPVTATRERDPPRLERITLCLLAAGQAVAAFACFG